jgi:hypothetical protein
LVDNGGDQPRTRKALTIGAATVVSLGLTLGSSFYYGRTSSPASAVASSTIDADRVKELEGARDAADSALEGERRKNAALTALLERHMGESQARAAIEAEVPTDPLGSVSLLVRTVEANTQFFEALRTERKLRALNDDERGWPLARMPIRTFAFSAAGNMVRADQFGRVLDQERSEAEHESRFEVQRLEDGEFHVIVFAEPSAAARAANLDGQTRYEIDTYTRPLGTRTSMVSIPVNRLVSSTSRYNGTTTAVAFVLR